MTKALSLMANLSPFDLGNYDLNVISADPSVATNALWVKNSGHVYLDGTGQFNISLIGDKPSTGVRVEAGSSATVTNIRVTVFRWFSFLEHMPTVTTQISMYWAIFMCLD